MLEIDRRHTVPLQYYTHKNDTDFFGKRREQNREQYFSSYSKYLTKRNNHQRNDQQVRMDITVLKFNTKVNYPH